LRLSIKVLGPVLAGLALFAALAATPALALPRTYQVQRVSTPATPQIGGKFASGVVNAGDLNGDGEEDLLVAAPGEINKTGRVYVVSGESGVVLRPMYAPDPDVGAPDPDAGGPLPVDDPSEFGSYVGKIADLGSCQGGAANAICPGTVPEGGSEPVIGDPDGVPDILVTAPGVDVAIAGGSDELIDAGRAYLYDGKTGALLKRIDMPATDLQAQFSAVLGMRKPSFGQSVLNPSSRYGPTGISGPALPVPSVQRGDLDEQGAGDIVVGAPGYFETDETASVQSPCQLVDDDFPPDPDADEPDTLCLNAGRAYVFYGESIAGTNPATIEDTPNVTIKNPTAQPDVLTRPAEVNSESMGSSITPVGDLGRCISDPDGDETIGGTLCTFGESTQTPDGKPDYVLSSHRTDEFGMIDVGDALLVDGATASVLFTFTHPEPQPSSLFALSSYNQPAIGDVGPQSNNPDVFVPAIRQNNPSTAGGRGYIMNGAFRSGANSDSINFAILNDPTPNAGGNFGSASAGIGNVDSDLRTEVMVGALGSSGPGSDENVINDVHIYRPVDESLLQTIRDPDQEAGSAFGSALAPVGDLNEDGFVDFAIGAPRYGGSGISDEGRLYILRSDDSPAPAGPAPPPSGGGSGGGSTVTLAGRALELEASRHKVRRGRQVRLRGLLEAFTNAGACQSRQPVLIQRRRPGSLRYASLVQVRTSTAGRFSATITPSRTFYYRARVRTTVSCLGAISPREKVTVKRTKRRSATRTKSHGNNG
jgi:hypothetical protein